MYGRSIALLEVYWVLLEQMCLQMCVMTVQNKVTNQR